MLTTDKQSELAALSTALVVDAMSSLDIPQRVLDPAIRPVAPVRKMVGSARTVQFRSQPDASKANFDFYKQTLGDAGGHDCPVIVLAVPSEHHRQAIFGDGSATVASTTGYVGALIEGAARDIDDIREMGFPTFSRVVSPATIIGHVEAVAAGVPVVVGGVTIHPDEIVFGDSDGVVIMACDGLDAVIEKAKAIRDWEERLRVGQKQGLPPDQLLEQAGQKP